MLNLLPPAEKRLSFSMLPAFYTEASWVYLQVYAVFSGAPKTKCQQVGA